LDDIEELIRRKKIAMDAAEIPTPGDMGQGQRANAGQALKLQEELNVLLDQQATTQERIGHSYITFLAKKEEERRQEERTKFTDAETGTGATGNAKATKGELKQLNQYDSFLKKMDDEIRLREALGKVEKDEAKWWNEALKLKIAAKDAEGNMVPGDNGNKRVAGSNFTEFEKVQSHIDTLKELRDIEEQNKQTKKENAFLDKQDEDNKNRITADIERLISAYNDLENPTSKYHKNLELINEAEHRGRINALEASAMRLKHYSTDTEEGVQAARLKTEAERMNESARGGSIEGQMEKLNALMATGSLSAAVYKHRWYEIRKAGEDAFGTMLKLGEDFANTLGDAFGKMISGVKQDWRKLIADMIAQAASAYASQAFRAILQFAI